MFTNAHAYHINSISVNSDGQTFISADDLVRPLFHSLVLFFTSTTHSAVARRSNCLTPQRGEHPSHALFPRWQRVNLWNLEASNTSFNLVDIKPSNMEDLTEARILPPPLLIQASCAVGRSALQPQVDRIHLC